MNEARQLLPPDYNGKLFSPEWKMHAVNRQWPIWAEVLAAKAIPEDKGVGDVAARLIGHETSEKFKAFYMVTFGKPCGCNGRQARWNLMFPLNADS